MDRTGSGTMWSGGDHLDMAPVETALAILRTACDQAVDELGGAVPGAQLRALLIISDAGGSLDLNRLAAGLAAPASATTRLCERMRAAGLLRAEDLASGPAGPCSALTGSGGRLARWVRDRQRAAVIEVLNSMRPQARVALVHGLCELAADRQPP
jgi:MarR family